MTRQRPGPVRARGRCRDRPATSSTHGCRSTWGGTEPLTLADGSTRTFLADGDTATLTATAPGASGGRIALGEVTGRVEPAPAP